MTMTLLRRSTARLDFPSSQPDTTAEDLLTLVSNNFKKVAENQMDEWQKATITQAK